MTAAWPVASRNVVPGPAEARIWSADLEPGAEVAAHMKALLSPDERDRAARFHFRRDAMRWIVARATLREILGVCLDTDPHAVAFAYGEKGKPYLARRAGSLDLQFSLAHSAELAMYAVTVGYPVGVDVERLRAVPGMDRIAERTFSPEECAALRALPEALRPAGFFNCWTRKEAYIKAVGLGLSYPLARFSVSLAPGEPAQLRSVEIDPTHVETWTMTALAPRDGFVGAVVVGARPVRVVCERWAARG
ncbi:MAG TPA: 4'-phosphopantetheinyl transferase superfamily protein [Methylomirabilota bacterium]|nr:4'-phosphopantetheinyl transferase superfamily protein [Methylomirabilota bacterium]